MSEENIDQLDPDEPHTPAWFTFVGIGLFLVTGIYFLATADEEEEAAPSTAAAATEERPQPPPPSE
jgi:hypothetical protein